MELGKEKFLSLISSLLMASARTARKAACDRAYSNQGENEIPNPCAGPSSLLAILDRPSVSGSACAVPQGQVIMEMGFQHANVEGPGSGTTDNYPEAEVRFGLPGRNEFVLLPPNYLGADAGFRF